MDHFGKRDWNMNLITMVPATARFIAQMRGMRRHIVENNVTEFAVFQIGAMRTTRGGRKLLTADAPLLSRSSSPTGTVGRMRTVGNMRRSLTITSGTTS